MKLAFKEKYVCPHLLGLYSPRLSYGGMNPGPQEWLKWIKKKWYLLTVLLASQREDETPRPAEKWTEAEDSTLVEISQTQEDSFCVLSLLCGS